MKVYKDESELYNNPEVKKIESTKSDGPRGKYYHYIYIDNDGIIAFGDEQGNYAGGVYANEYEVRKGEEQYDKPHFFRPEQGFRKETIESYLKEYVKEDYKYYLDMEENLGYITEYAEIFNKINKKRNEKIEKIDKMFKEIGYDSSLECKDKVHYYKTSKDGDDYTITLFYYNISFNKLYKYNSPSIITKEEANILNKACKYLMSN